ncbi:hypothetical protein HOLleu_15264 [Holothuria leucospilota]|uniref:Uncharacterized protein n=1 Tax=Holothuria leucospilota TaxID=206669 RepID=A0A9Q1HD60_HOLLE|nr:hypothetical protein HOLleu_15264 [Holothuria leucospilota]
MLHTQELRWPLGIPADDMQHLHLQGPKRHHTLFPTHHLGKFPNVLQYHCHQPNEAV